MFWILIMSTLDQAMLQTLMVYIVPTTCSLLATTLCNSLSERGNKSVILVTPSASLNEVQL